jgi:hypothetical protein
MMAELHDLEAKRLMQTFVRGYNALHNSAFAFDPAASAVNASGPSSQRDLSVDFICSCPSSKDRILVQHTEAWSDCQSERFWKRHVGVVRHGAEQIASAVGGDPVLIILDIDKAPSSPGEARAVIAALDPELRVRAGQVRSGEHVDWQPLGAVRCVVSRVSLRRPLGLGRSIVLASDSAAHLDPVGFRAAQALERKALRYGASGSGLILLIDYRVTTYDPEDLSEIRRAVEAVPHAFAEVWVASDWWIDEPQAHRVWAEGQMNLHGALG